MNKETQAELAEAVGAAVTESILEASHTAMDAMTTMGGTLRPQVQLPSGKLIEIGLSLKPGIDWASAVAAASPSRSVARTGEPGVPYADKVDDLQRRAAAANASGMVSYE